MDNSVDFDINNALKHYLSDPATISTPEADEALLDCENDPDSLSNGLINQILNPIVDSIIENPEALLRSNIFDSLQFLLKCAPTFLASERPTSFPTEEPDSELFKLSRSASLLPTHSLSKLFDLIISGLSSEADVLSTELDADEQDALLRGRKLLEMYAFLLQWSIAVVEVKAAEKPPNAAAAPKGRGATKGGGKSKSAAPRDGSWDSSSQLQTALETMCKVMKLRLGKIFITASERDTFVGLFTRPVYLVLENEPRIKNTALRMHAFKVLCIAVKHHGHAFGRVGFSGASKLWLIELQGRKHPLYRTCPILSIWLNQWLNSCTYWQSNTIILS